MQKMQQALNVLQHIGVTATLAVWGALLSTFTLGWTLYRDLRDRAKIKISADLYRVGIRPADGRPFVARPDMMVEGASGEIFVVVSVVNVGRRPFRWKGIGGNYKTRVNGKNAFVITTRFLPKILDEQEELYEWFELDPALVNGNVKKLMLWDSAGGNWTIPMKKLKADIDRYIKENPVAG